MKRNKKDNLTLPEQFMLEQNPDKLQEIIDMFNLDIKKKNMLRTARINEVQDKITEQIAQRIEKRADEFSNIDLLNYFKVMQDSLVKNPMETSLPKIQINQTNQVNINVDENGLDRRSRERVANAVRNILRRTSEESAYVADSDIIDIPESDITVVEENS